MAATLPLTLLAPVILLIAAACGVRRQGRRPRFLPWISEISALMALLLSIAGIWQFSQQGPSDFAVLRGPMMIKFRVDSVSVAMVAIVAFIAWIVMRYSRSYLDGERDEGKFHCLMLTTLAAALIFVQSGSLAVLILSTISVGFGLKRLLLFYPERPEAQRAALKFAYVWHGGDAALVLAGVVLFVAFGTSDITVLAAHAESGHPFALNLAVALLVISASFKTALFPLHGWLTEVMEAPTPVSALLHAGIINSGGVMLITFANLIQQSPGVMALLVMVGGFTAIFGATVMLTQAAIKTALAWSTVSQMGFMMLQCGLGLWPLALLHIVAHSLYKAHAFLSAGGAIAAVAELRRPGPVAVPSLVAVLRSFVLAILLYAAIAVVFTSVAGYKGAQSLTLGAILIFGVAYLVAQGLADTAPKELTRRTVLASVAAAIAYFSFQEIAVQIWGAALPSAPFPGPLEWALIVLALMSFGLIALAQALFPLWAHHPATTGLRVHIANGLYLNALLDKALGGFRAPRSD